MLSLKCIRHKQLLQLLQMLQLLFLAATNCRWHIFNYIKNNRNNKNSSNNQKKIHISNSVKNIHWPGALFTCMLLCSLWHGSECFHGSFKLSNNLIRTKNGLLRGIVVRSSPLVEAYLGIPYASPPMGSLRYMPPITPSTWKNVRIADRFSPVCPQTVPIPPNGPEALLEVPRARLAQLRRLLPLLKNQSEDCLYLNIYAPMPIGNKRNNNSVESGTPKLSTILYIHGESYEWNSGNPYDGTELAAHGNVIVVTINFRLGIFGFLKTGGKESAQGNFGLMDLVAGMHWLKENLSAFGGNPQNITLLGHGSGAALANILAISPVASDLLQRVVMVSGSALSPWAIQKNPLFVKRRVAEQTGCHGDMLYDDLAPCLRTKSIEELLAVKIDHPRFLAGFAPFIDGTVISSHTEVNDLTLPFGSTIVSTSGIEYANFLKRDLIFCLTSVESYLDLSAQDLEFGFNETRRDRILRTFVRNNYHYHLNEIFAVLKNEYTDWEKAIRNPMNSRDATLAFLSDGHTASPLIKVGYMHSLSGGRGYFMHFKHKTTDQEFPQRSGSVRGEDVPFWFGLPTGTSLFPYNYTTQEKKLSRYMLHYLANFAKTGNPNHVSSSPIYNSMSNLHRHNNNNNNNNNDNNNNIINNNNNSNNIELRKIKRSAHKTNYNNSGKKSPNHTLRVDLKKIKSNVTALSEEKKALNLAIIYNQRRSNKMRDKREFRKRHLKASPDDSNYFIPENPGEFDEDVDEMEEEEKEITEKPVSFDKEHLTLPFWDAYDVVNQLYLELGSKLKTQSHYRGHKLSMWLNLIPQLHKHTNLHEQSMRHHQFPDHINNLYEGVVRPQLPIKSMEIEDEEKTTTKILSSTQKSIVIINDLIGTECAVNETVAFTLEPTLLPPNITIGSQKDLVTASTGLMGNLEVLRRLSGKQFQSYTTALVATVAVGFFLLVLNVLIFAGIYYQREKRARDARTKEELEDKDASKNSSLLKLNTVGVKLPTEAYTTAGKTTVIFSEYNCYDEKSSSLELNKEQIPMQSIELMQGKRRASISGSFEFPLILKKADIHANVETNVYNLFGGQKQQEQQQQQQEQQQNEGNIECDLSTNNFTSFVSNTSCQLNQFDFAVQSSDQMSFKDIEAAVKGTSNIFTELTLLHQHHHEQQHHHDIDLDIPEPPPPPRSFQTMQQQPQQQHQTGILRQSGTTGSNATSGISTTSGGKKRVHIQEISV